MKNCSGCKIEKELFEFSKLSRNKDGLHSRCKTCVNADNKSYRDGNKEKVKIARKEHYKKNRVKLLKEKKKYADTHKEDKAEYDKKYREDNKKDIASYKKVWERNQKMTNPDFRIKANLRRRLTHALKGSAKSASTMKLLGCSINDLMTHLQNQFTKGMSFDNYGAWHIDHIMPCSAYDLTIEAQQEKCFNYTNLQPLWAIDNYKKGTKMKTRTRELTKNEIIELGEMKYFKHLMDTFPNGILSVVSDTFDLWSVLTKTLPELKEEILARDGKIVIRPDSGDPVDIICGKPILDCGYKGDNFEEWKSWAADTIDDIFRDNLDAEYPHNSEIEIFSFKGSRYEVEYTPDLNRHDKTYYYVDNYGTTVSKCAFVVVDTKVEDKGVIELLWDIFGGTVNEQGYKILDSHIGAIYGDSITIARAEEICKRLEAKGFASTNIVLGIGSYTYQYNTRDTHGFAMKATYVEVNGEGRAIFKDPITDDGTKKSAKGLLYVEKEDGKYVLHDDVFKGNECTGSLRTIFEDGFAYRLTSLTEIRERLK